MQLRVLVVEDEIVLLKLMAETLKSCGAEVVALSDSNLALLRLRLEKFDGIFLDMLMPGVTGLELTREARKSSCNRNTPIVVVTGLDRPDTMRGVFGAGATFLLHKPVDRRKLVRLFETIRGTMLEERRRFCRIPMKGTVTCIHGIRIMEGRAGDLSEAGVLFQGDDSLRTDDRVTLSFNLPGTDQAIEAQAIVARIDGSKRVQCHFTDMAEGNREAIRAIVAAGAQTSASPLMGWDGPG
jgi:CheY-like chemotaxis protein